VHTAGGAWHLAKVVGHSPIRAAIALSLMLVQAAAAAGAISGAASLIVIVAHHDEGK